MTNSNFDEYIKNNDIKSKAIIEEISYDFEKIYSQFNTIEQQNAHEVKPIYITAKHSNDVIVLIGIFKVYANVLAIVTPILTPVNDPGPLTTNISSNS